MAVQFDSQIVEQLVSLLEDSDETVTNQVEKRFLSFGIEVIGYLEDHLLQETSEIVQLKCTSIIQSLRLLPLQRLTSLIMTSITDDEEFNMEEAVFLLSQFKYPRITHDEVFSHIEIIAQEVKLLLDDLQVSNHLTTLMMLNQVFFEQRQFRAASNDFYSPENTYLASMLQSKQGIPISLCVLYLIIANRVGIDIYGVGMPLHFVVYNPYLSIYIDVFNNGVFLSESECKKFIVNSGFQFEPYMLERATNVSIIVRTARNLVHAHKKHNQDWEAKVLESFIEDLQRIAYD
jgi:regulator of sirC expression with transglutaminase-like and TPR domain